MRCHRAGNWRWERVANLTVRVSLRTRDRPIVGESLDAGGHADRQAWVPLKVRIRGLGRNRGAIDAQLSPSAPGSGGSQVGTAVLLGATHERRCDAIGAFRPLCRTRPTARRHQVAERLSDRGWRFGQGLGVLEGSLDILTESNGDDAWTQLRDTEIRGLKELPLEGITDLSQVLLDSSTVLLELWVQKPAYILDHDGARPHDAYKLNHGGEEIALVIGA